MQTQTWSATSWALSSRAGSRMARLPCIHVGACGLDRVEPGTHHRQAGRTAEYAHHALAA